MPKVGFTNRMPTKQKLRKIDIGDLSRIAAPQSLKGFYLSPDDKLHKLYESKDSFVFTDFVIGLCLDGSGTIKVNGNTYNIGRGTLMLLPPNQLMEEPSLSPDFVRRTIVVSLDTILGFPSPADIDILNASRRMPVVRITDEKMAHLVEYYRFIEREYAEIDNIYREEIAKTLLYAMMLEVCGIYKSLSGKNTDSRRMRQEKLSDEFFSLLARNYKTERSVAFYADRMHRTPKYLSGEIKRITGRSILDWINEQVIVEIKTQLKTTDRTILQISEDMNFSSPSVFVQYFKHHTGITPLKYRRTTDQT